jgi:predicted dehydrogenase
VEHIGVGVVGAGSVNIATSSHLPAIMQVPELRLVALADIQSDGVQRYAEQYGVDWYTDYKEMLARPDIQMIQICTPDFLHAEQVVIAAEAGKHILCQKPLAVSVSELQAMKQAVIKAGVQFMAVQSTRYQQGFRALGAVVKSGAIGQVRYVRYASRGRFFTYPEGSYYRTAASGGQFVHNGPHAVDLVCALLGETPEEVCAMAQSHYPTDDRLETENYWLTQLRFPSGASATVEMNLLMLDPPGYPPQIELEVVGTKGILNIGVDSRPTIELFAKGNMQYLSIEKRNHADDPFVLLMQEFAQAIISGTPAPIPMDFSMAVNEACLKTVTSARQNKPERLEGGWRWAV